ncbi:putative structural constituent of cytoskeleton [Blattamonas nauphoetae]|uniref:Arp2/3 complex 41 kDa subunit n=1 Tax=Blattamonas nauphoetae TaxID=2049346 RepID=A0ABQ9Y053_9EUKA|nr:putative structural constituent of cytoskeleton [Blattamonas nauphoetae]
MLYNNITCFSFNKDHSKIAIVPNKNTAEIWNVNGTDPKDWTLDKTLKSEHAQLITGIDWAPNTNRLLTCSQDRNAYVWLPPDEKNPEWTPQIVLLRFSKAATCCAWSPNEDKFAVGGSEKYIAVCYFEAEADWWVSKRIRLHKSAVLSLAWHPSNVMLASTGNDFRMMVHSAAIKEIGETKSEVEGFPPIDFCGKEKQPLYTHTISGSWMNCCSFSASGRRLACCSRNSTVHITHFEEGAPREFIVMLTTLPFSQLVFVDEDTIVCGGFDEKPTILTFAGDNWSVSKTLDIVPNAAGEKKEQTMGQSAMDRFKALSSTGQAGGAVKAAVTDRHTNDITHIALGKPKADGSVDQIVTSGMDGKIYFWKL